VVERKEGKEQKMNIADEEKRIRVEIHYMA